MAENGGPKQLQGRLADAPQLQLFQEDGLSQVQWTLRAAKERQKHGQPQSKLIIRHYSALLAGDVMGLEPQISAAEELDVGRLEFLKAIFEWNWTSDTQPPDVRIRIKDNSYLVVDVGKWIHDCDGLKHGRDGENKSVCRLKGELAYIRFMPAELGLRFDVVDYDGRIASLDNVQFHRKTDIEKTLAGLIKRYEESETRARKEFELDSLIYCARCLIYHWYKDSDGIYFSPVYNLTAPRHHSPTENQEPRDVREDLDRIIRALDEDD